MTDHDAALRLDAALDQFVLGASTPDDVLLDTARTLQQLDASQQAIPSAEFRARLRVAIAGNASVDQSNGHHPVAAGTLPAPLLEHPAQPRGSHRWLAIAAALLLLLAGGGAIVLEGIGLRDDSEPSAIPAASFASPAVDQLAAGTPAADATDSGIAWIVNGPKDAYVQALPQMAFSDGRIFRSVTLRDGSEQLQAVDAGDGAVVWEVPSAVRVNAMRVYDEMLLVAGLAGEFPEYDNVLVALDTGTGEERWRAPLSQLPVDMEIVGTWALVLSNDNNLDAIDLETHQVDYVADIGGRSQPLDKIPNKAFSSNDRMAVIDQTLAVVLADGSIGGYDVETGMGQWWVIDTVPSRARVYAIDGTFVVIVDGSWEEIVATPNAGKVTPVPEASPGPTSCRDLLSTFTGDAVWENDAPENLQRTFLGIDPETGDPRWAGGSTGDVTLDVVSDRGLDLVIIPPAARTNDSAQVAICAVDASTGEVSQVDRFADLPGRTVRMLFADEADVDVVVAMLDNDRFLALPASLLPDGDEPTVEFGTGISPGGSALIGVFDGELYLTLQDGRLVKVDIPDQ